MAALERLVGTVAETEGLTQERIRAIARAIRQGGLIATLGRGLSAAQMTERDAANLLIAVNVADTALTAPQIVGHYRRLRTSSRTWSAYFGTELERLLAAAGAGTIADFVSSLLRHANPRSPLVSKRYGPDDYEIAITFRKPMPCVTIYVAAPRGGAPEEIRFSQRAESSSATAPDRILDVTITQRTIIAVAELLRDRDL